jgi:hypothetical protein
MSLRSLFCAVLHCGLLQKYACPRVAFFIGAPQRRQVTLFSSLTDLIALPILNPLPAKCRSNASAFLFSHSSCLHTRHIWWLSSSRFLVLHRPHISPPFVNGLEHSLQNPVSSNKRSTKSPHAGHTSVVSVAAFNFN